MYPDYLFVVGKSNRRRMHLRAIGGIGKNADLLREVRVLDLEAGEVKLNLQLHPQHCHSIHSSKPIHEIQKLG